MSFNRAGRGGSRRDFQSRGRSSYGNDRPKQMFSAVCDNCGKECQVPFRPTSGKPVYCSECFEKMNGGNSDRPRRERSNLGFEELNAKLDRILNLLENK